MKQSSRSIFSTLFLRGIVPAALTFVLVCPADVVAQTAQSDHLVTPQALNEQVQNSAQSREQNIRTVTDFLSTPTAERAMQDAHFNPIEVRTAIPTLSDHELQNLAMRASDAQQKFAAGAFGVGLLTLLIIIVVVIIVVAAVH